MRKKLFRKRATLLALFLGVVMTSIAQTTFTINKLNYQVNEDGTSVTVTGHTDGYEATGELEIPASVNYNEKDYTVTAVGQSAFMYCFYLSKLTLPNTITTIGEGAFSYCQSFKGDLVIPNSVKEVGYNAFSGCSGFDGQLIIGSSVESLGDYAFSGCAGLTGTLNLPANVTSIGSNTFGYNGFDAIVVDPDNSVYDSREQCNAIVETNTNTLITGCKNSIIPEGITDIGYCAFRGILNLTAVELPQSLVTIGENAFALCYDLTGDLTIPDLVTTIGPSAFYGCEKLTGTLTLGESVSYIGDWAFKKCSGFTGAVSRATTPPEIGNEFGYYTAFESFGCQILIIPDGCTDAYMNSNLHDELGLCGFSTFIEESDNVVEEFTEFAAGKYNYRVNKDDVSVTVISHVDGYEASGEINIPETVNYEGKDYTVTSIGSYAFMYNSSFTTLTLPSTIVTIGDGAFAGCNGFTGDLLIPDAVTTIGYGAFSYCSGFNGKLTIGRSVAFIGDQAFANCNGFTSAVSRATVPPTLDDSYGEPLTFNDFGCSTVTVPSGSASAYQASAWYDPTGQKGFKEFVESGDISSIGGTFAANRNNGSIYDVSGKRIYVDGNHLPAGLKPGIYFIKTESQNGTKIKKITVK